MSQSDRTKAAMAIATATGESFASANSALAEQGPTIGVSINNMIAACELLGYTMKGVPVSYYTGGAKTADVGSYILELCDSVESMVDGERFGNSTGRVYCVYQVVKNPVSITVGRLVQMVKNAVEAFKTVITTVCARLAENLIRRHVTATVKGWRESKRPVK